MSVSATGTALPARLPSGVHALPYGYRMDDVHRHDPPTRKAQQLLRTTFAQLMDHSVMHVRVDYSDQRQLLKVHGTAAQLHGPRGKCSCCPRSPRLTVDGDPVGY